YKRAYDGDVTPNPNTGGMGAKCPLPDVGRREESSMFFQILIPTIRAMHRRGIPYKGLLYAGVMLTEDGPKLIEYNCRFGDPETQVVLPLLKSDLVPYLAACANGTLSKMPRLEWRDSYAQAVTMTAKGYPGSYEKGKIITGLEMARKLPHVIVYEAGTEVDEEGNKITN